LKYLGVYRIATYLLVLFCLGHTAGGNAGAERASAPSRDAVFSSMKAVHFDFNGADCHVVTAFWFAFGLNGPVGVPAALGGPVDVDALGRESARRGPSVAPIRGGRCFAAPRLLERGAQLAQFFFCGARGAVDGDRGACSGIGALRAASARPARKPARA